MKDDTRRILEQGLVAGVIGHIVVAVTFAIGNLAAGRPLLHTPALLGASMFYGLTDPSQLEIRAAYVFAYNGTHLLLFLLLGTIGAWLATIADRGWQLWYLETFFFMFVAFHLFGMVQLLAQPVRSAVSDVVLWVAGLLATCVMAAYFIATHPRLRAQLAHWEEQ
jgi:hypothetical protein